METEREEDPRIALFEEQFQDSITILQSVVPDELSDLVSKIADVIPPTTPGYDTKSRDPVSYHRQSLQIDEGYMTIWTTSVPDDGSQGDTRMYPSLLRDVGVKLPRILRAHVQDLYERWKKIDEAPAEEFKALNPEYFKK